MVSKKFCDFCGAQIEEDSQYELEVIQFDNSLDACNGCLGKINAFLDDMKSKK